MNEQQKLDFMAEIASKHDELPRAGMAELIKVILSIASILLTVLATLEASKPQLYSFCEQPIIVTLRFSSYISLLLCICFCVYHLQYALNVFHTKMIELPNNAIQSSTTISEAWCKLKENNSVAHPYLYQKSIPIVFFIIWLFIGFTLSQSLS